MNLFTAKSRHHNIFQDICAILVQQNITISQILKLKERHVPKKPILYREILNLMNFELLIEKIKLLFSSVTRSSFILWLKRFAIFRFLLWVLKNMWPFIILFLFRHEIDGFLSQWSWWFSVKDLAAQCWNIIQESQIYGWMSNAWHTGIVPAFEKMWDIMLTSWDSIKGYFGEVFA